MVSVVAAVTATPVASFAAAVTATPVASLDPQFQSLVTALEVPKAVADFLATNGILDSVSYALLSHSELNLKEDLVDMFKSNGVKVDSLKDVIAIKK